MKANPLPNQSRPFINAITKDSSMRIKTKVDEINSSMDEVYNVMVKIGIILEKKIYECFF